MACDGSDAPARRRHWPEAEKRRMVAEVGVDGQSRSRCRRTRAEVANASSEVVLANGRRLVAAEGIAPARLRLLIAAVEAA